MPQKRNSKLLFTKRQKALIDSRLMQISLKVDDYVYKQIPISAKNADLYIKEVTGYKDKCLGDKRSMQVIDKLVRCMTGVIQEQQQLQEANDDVTMADAENISSSMDEDFTQLSQEIEKISMDTKQTKNIEMGVCQFNGKIRITKHVNQDENETIDFSKSSRNKTNEIENEHQFIDNLNRAISGLTINEENILTIGNVYAKDCSQSVLQDSSHVYTGNSQNAKEKLDIHNENVNHFVQTNNISKEINNKNVNIQSAPPAKTRKRKLLNLLTLANNVTAVRTTEYDVDSYFDSEIMSDKKKEGTKPLKISKNNNKIEANKQTKQKKGSAGRKMKQICMKKKQSKINYRGEETKCSDSAVSVPAGKNILTPKIATVNKTNDTVQNTWIKGISYNHDSATYSKNTFTEKPIIYKQNVEKDLSWIENLRYVREISEEEKIPALNDESFWNDYTLPNDWNDDEFL